MIAISGRVPVCQKPIQLNMSLQSMIKVRILSNGTGGVRLIQRGITSRKMWKLRKRIPFQVHAFNLAFLIVIYFDRHVPKLTNLEHGVESGSETYLPLFTQDRPNQRWFARKRRGSSVSHVESCVLQNVFRSRQSSSYVY